MFASSVDIYRSNTKKKQQFVSIVGIEGTGRIFDHERVVASGLALVHGMVSASAQARNHKKIGAFRAIPPDREAELT
jgi:hypothetical protein